MKKKTITHITNNQYRSEYFAKHGIESPFNSKEEEEAELRLFEEHRREFIDELIEKAQERQKEPLNEQQIEDILQYAADCQNFTIKAIEHRLDELRIIKGN